MTVIARFEVIPVREGSMSTAIAEALRALERHPVSYQTTATDTIIEAETVEQVLAAVGDAHLAIPEDRVITSLEIDEDRRRPQNVGERVASVERELGHPPQRGQGPPQQPPASPRQQPSQPPMQTIEPTQVPPRERGPPEQFPSPGGGGPPDRFPSSVEGMPPGRSSQTGMQPPGGPSPPTR